MPGLNSSTVSQRVRLTLEQREDLRAMDEKEQALERQLAALHERRREYINTNELNKGVIFEQKTVS